MKIVLFLFNNFLFLIYLMLLDVCALNLQYIIMTGHVAWDFISQIELANKSISHGLRYHINTQKHLSLR